MLPQAYLDEFVRLQDNVPTFSTMEARVVLEEGLDGKPVDAVFEWLSEEPIAAASLGQVGCYSSKGTNRSSINQSFVNILIRTSLIPAFLFVLSWTHAGISVQVYRGKLRPEYGSGEVAVKVQRPGVLEAASLDIFLLRRAAGLLAKVPGMSDQWALTLDDWALRFFQVCAMTDRYMLVDCLG